MKKKLENRPLKERFHHLLNFISSSFFLEKQGLGNEIPFYICPYNPEETVEMEQAQQNLLKQLETRGISILQINLYDLSIDLFRQRNIWDKTIEAEQSITKQQLLQLFQSVLAPQDHLIPAIEKKMKGKPYFQVLFLTGVGEVFPYIRSHSVLNNLQAISQDKPTILFFPGAYTYTEDNGASLSLFGKLNDDRYYRAFNIYQYQVKEKA